MSQTQPTTMKNNFVAHLKCAACGQQEAAAFASVNVVVECGEWMRVRQVQIPLCAVCAEHVRNGVDALALARALGGVG